MELKIKELKGTLEGNIMERTFNFFWFWLERLMLPWITLDTQNNAGYMNGSFPFFRLKIHSFFNILCHFSWS
jgi:hypothetical protein